MPISMTQNGQKYYLHYDQIGTLKAVSNSNQRVIKKITYDSYGNILNETNQSFNVPFGFAGGLYDHDTKLTRFGYRDYDAYSGKWTAKDPIDFGDSNLYGYVLGDPISSFDLNGLQPDKDKIYRCTSNYFSESLHAFLCADGKCTGLYPSIIFPFGEKTGSLDDDTESFDNPKYTCIEQKPKGEKCN